MLNVENLQEIIQVQQIPTYISIQTIFFLFSGENEENTTESADESAEIKVLKLTNTSYSNCSNAITDKQTDRQMDNNYKYMLIG